MRPSTKARRRSIHGASCHQEKTKMTKMMKKRVKMKKSKATKTKWATKDD